MITKRANENPTKVSPSFLTNLLVPCIKVNNNIEMKIEVKDVRVDNSKASGAWGNLSL
jgi:protein subunit release factor A